MDFVASAANSREETDQARPPSLEAVGPARWSSRLLLGDGRLAVIVHEGAEYRLQLTRQNKLLLTK